MAGDYAGADERPCVFCKIYANKEDLIFENEYFFAQLDKYPVTPGHAEVIPKRHVKSLLELERDEWVLLRPTLEEVIDLLACSDLRALYRNYKSRPLDETSVKYLEFALASPFLKRRPDAYNHGVNDGLAAGRTVHHLHWHIIPRFLGDMDDPRGGVRHVIPAHGNYKISAPALSK
jgi:histidine triad (HIT) family protein